MPSSAERSSSEVNETGPTVPMTPVTDGSDTVPVPQRSSEPPAESATSAARKQRSLVEHEERGSERRRVLNALVVALIGWNVFSGLDLARFLLGTHEEILEPLGVRAALSLPVIAAYLWLRAKHEAPRLAVRAIEIGTFTCGGIGIGSLALLDGGLESYHLQGLVLVLLAHALTLGGSYRRALAPLLAPLFSAPAVLAVGALFDRDLAAQWQSATSQAAFLEDFAFVLGGAAVAFIGGHSVWSLRQQLAQSRSVGRYRLRRRIATGGMGEIWSAYHAALKRDVAVKLIQPRLGRNEHAVARFEREARALAELTHPHVVRVFDYGATEDGIWYYAMELLHGDDLQAVVEAEGPLEPERAVRLLRQGAEALAEAHGRAMVHRDVKPANFFLVRSEGGEFVKLVDFGIAKIDDGEGASGLTAPGMVLGTPGYMAPEVIRGGEATPRSDVYALGAVLYYVLAGCAPFEARTAQALVLAHLTEDPTPPSERVEGLVLDPELEALIMRCLAKDELARPRDAGEMASELRRIERAS